MNVISCKSCGVLLDGDILDFTSTTQVGDEFVVLTPCPVCLEQLEGEMSD